MNLHSLKKPKGSDHRRIRVGRGRGSGKGKTCGRGHKGQMSRSGARRKPTFEGGQIRLLQRIPKRGFTNYNRKVYFPVNLKKLNDFEDGAVVTPELLREKGLVKGRTDGIKILAVGELERKLTVKAHRCSDAAKEKIEAAGGSFEAIS